MIEMPTSSFALVKVGPLLAEGDLDRGRAAHAVAIPVADVVEVRAALVAAPVEAPHVDRVIVVPGVAGEAAGGEEKPGKGEQERDDFLHERQVRREAVGRITLFRGIVKRGGRAALFLFLFFIFIFIPTSPLSFIFWQRRTGERWG